MCKHSNFKHQLYMTCCQKYFDCTYCHREYHQGNDVINKILNIKCNKCQKKQSCSNICINPKCKIQFAFDYCDKCAVWSDSKLHHCHSCKICYFNVLEELIHCDGCQKCYYKLSFDDHKCNINKDDYQCQICLEKISISNKKYYYLKCNHIIHHECYDSYKKICEQQHKTMTCGLCRERI